MTTAAVYCLYMKKKELLVQLDFWFLMREEKWNLHIFVHLHFVSSAMVNREIVWLTTFTSANVIQWRPSALTEIFMKYEIILLTLQKVGCLFK